jgi:hypothetical protein
LQRRVEFEPVMRDIDRADAVRSSFYGYVLFTRSHRQTVRMGPVAEWLSVAAVDRCRPDPGGVRRGSALLGLISSNRLAAAAATGLASMQIHSCGLTATTRAPQGLVTLRFRLEAWHAPSFKAVTGFHTCPAHQSREIESRHRKKASAAAQRASATGRETRRAAFGPGNCVFATEVVSIQETGGREPLEWADRCMESHINIEHPARGEPS